MPTMLAIWGRQCGASSRSPSSLFPLEAIPSCTPAPSAGITVTEKLSPGTRRPHRGCVPAATPDGAHILLLAECVDPYLMTDGNELRVVTSPLGKLQTSKHRDMHQPASSTETQPSQWSMLSPSREEPHGYDCTHRGYLP